MTLFSVVKKNMLGNFKSYLFYFISMLISVVIYYTFSSLQYSSEIQANMKSQNLRDIFLQGSTMLILFVAVFIWYSNAFFTRKRKKEVALYSLLGVRKKTIGRMLLYENIVMGAIVLAAGILLGSFLSRLFAMILLKLSGAPVDIGFDLTWQSVRDTALVFAAIIAVTSFQAYRLVYRFKLIELFRADKEGEQEPRASVLSAVGAVTGIGLSYWFILRPFQSNADLMTNYIVFLIGFVGGTYLLFRSLTVFLLKASRRNKSRYYRGLNLVGTSHLLYRVRGNATMLTMIALLSAVTLISLGTTYTQYYMSGRHAEKVAPFSYMHLLRGDDFDAKVRELIHGDAAEHPVRSELDIPVLEVAGQSTNEELTPLRYREQFEKPIKVMSAGSYKAALRAMGRDGDVDVRVADGEGAAIRPLYTDFQQADYRGHTLTLSLPGGDKQLAFADLLETRVLNWVFPDFVVVVNDATFAQMAQDVQPIVYRAYEVADALGTQAVSVQLAELAVREDRMVSHYTVRKNALESNGLSTFIFGFLGLVFLAATGSLIYFKQLTEAQADQGRYDILRKIGVSRREIRLSVAKQSLFIFALPLIVGIVHSAVVLRAFRGLYSDLIGVNMTVPVMTVMLAYLAIYAGYYVLTVRSYDRIVNR